LSRAGLPKQFLTLAADRTLIQQAALRVHDPDLFEPLTVIASEQHRSLIAEQLTQVGIPAPVIVLEPSARNTAAAAAVAALIVAESDPEGLLLLLPSDHRIADVARFRAAVRNAMEAARSGFLSLFGITPDRPATGYGYIHVGAALAGAGLARSVTGFVEKPDRATAETYLESGDYLWNSGIFLLPSRAFLSELKRHEPGILEHAQDAFRQAARGEGVISLDRQAFDRCRSMSLDHAVMERTDRLAVLPVDFDWTDVGSWSTLAEMGASDDVGNTVLGEVITQSTKNSYIRSEGPLVATIGVEDLIVVATPDAILVAHKDHDQEIRQIVDRLHGGRNDRT
jgi:mannose-1-phosphate guanylyltransferase/mannose-1-phosphate guanylyltransferase/mannose-6-phosphate isomerase